MYKILIIEDDTSLCSILKESLEKYNYEVYIPRSFQTIEEEFKELKPQLVLLDINLPYFDGFYLCRSFRRTSSIPILFISARNGDMDQIMAMEMGADDYIVKPFNLEVALAKIRSTLRRTYGEYSCVGDGRVVINSFYIDEKAFKINYKDQSQELTKTEFKLINKLFDKRGEVVSREVLLEEMWDESFIAGDNALTVNITRVKAKLLALGLNDIIKTKRGAGYWLDTAIILGDSDE